MSDAKTPRDFGFELLADASEETPVAALVGIGFIFMDLTDAIREQTEFMREATRDQVAGQVERATAQRTEKF